MFLFTHALQVNVFLLLPLDGVLSKHTLFAESNLKLPHVGWKKTQFSNIEKNSFFSKFENQKFYYVHSYVAKLNNNKNILATAYYHNYKFIAGVKKENLIGFQFHPEKSGEVGLELINDLFRNY